MDSCKLNANHRQRFLVDQIKRNQEIKVKTTVILAIILLMNTEPTISYIMFESLINKTSDRNNCLFGTAQNLILDRV